MDDIGKVVTIIGIVAVGMVVVFLAWLDYDNKLSDDYNKVVNDYDALLADYNNLVDYEEDLLNDYDELVADYNNLVDYEEDLLNDYNKVVNDYDALLADYNNLVDYEEDLLNDYDALLADYNNLVDYEEDLLNDYDELVADYNEQYPITTISDTEVGWEFYDSKGNFYSWSMPITTYENLIQPSREYSLHQTYDNPKHVTINGRTVPVLNLDGFARESFSNVIDQVYDNSYDDSDFIYEVWYIVSQMTVYDEDITPESEGRFALETFTRTGGDCEDLVILVADMLMSSSHTRHWDFQYVMMDSDNLLDPQDIDHVILYVDDGQYGYYIEATAPPSWDHYPKRSLWLVV